MKEIPIWEKSNLTVEEAAAYSGIGINRLYEMTKDGSCPLSCGLAIRDSLSAANLMSTLNRRFQSDEEKFIKV